MAQLVVRNLSEAVKESLRRQARANGRSMEEEARQILRNGIRSKQQRKTNVGEVGWATALHRRLAAVELTQEDAAAFETAAELMRASPVRPAKFE